METIFILLTIQAAAGAFDNLWHHEITERLPSKPSARTEVGLHAVREFFYAFIFITIGWTAPQGVWAWLFGAVFMIEIGVTLTDFVVEDRTRRLPRFERILHTLLAINFGVILTFLLPEIYGWTQQPAGIAPRNYGVWSWVMTAFSAGVLAWALRDAVAFVTLTVLQVPEWQRRPIKAGTAADARTVLVTGGTGFIGAHLCRALIRRGDRVIVLSRDPALVRYKFGPHARALGSLDELGDSERIDAIVNLAGAPVAGWRWTKRRRRLLTESRLGVTRQVLKLIARLQTKPDVLVSGSAIGFYGIRGDAPVDESDGPQDIFMSRMCQEWERLAASAGDYLVRVCLLRTGLVLGRDGGVFPQMALSARLWAAAQIGDGRHGVSWIHIDDMVAMIQWLIAEPSVAGPVNAAAPETAGQGAFIRAIARACRRPVWLRVPGWALRLPLGEMAGLFADGQHVRPAKALAAGFTFSHPALEEAVSQLVAQESAAAEGVLSLHYNRACPVCRAEVDAYDRKARERGVPLALHDTGAEPEALAEWGLGPEDITRRMYVLGPGGELRGGADAFAAVWSAIPAYRCGARMVRLPVIRTLAAAIYDGVLAPTLYALNARRDGKADRRLVEPKDAARSRS